MASVAPVLDRTHPDETDASGGTHVCESTREQLTWLRTAITTGTLFDYDWAATGGTPTQPTTYIFTNGAEKIKVTIIWGITGGATGEPEIMLYEYSSDTGSTWATIGTHTYTYDADGNPISGAWT